MLVFNKLLYWLLNLLLFKLLTSGPAQENEAEDECQKENPEFNQVSGAIPCIVPMLLSNRN